jgi:hypothetical protein
VCGEVWVISFHECLDKRDDPSVPASTPAEADQPKERQTVLRTVLLLLPVLIIGGAAAIYVWSSINQLLHGEGTWTQGLITVGAFAVLIGIGIFLQRMSLSSEDADERSQR